MNTGASDDESEEKPTFYDVEEIINIRLHRSSKHLLIKWNSFQELLGNLKLLSEPQ